MTYEEVISAVKAAAANLSASFYYGTALRLNERRDIDYPVIVLSHRTHNITSDTFVDFGFVLWYLDIQQPDRRDAMQIQSMAIERLRQLNLRLEDAEIDADISLGVASVFSERFADIDAGAMCDLTIRAVAEDCPNSGLDYTNGPEPECTRCN